MNSWWVCLSLSLLHNQKHSNLRAQKLTHKVYKQGIIMIGTQCRLFSTLMKGNALSGYDSKVIGDVFVWWDKTNNFWRTCNLY